MSDTTTPQNGRKLVIVESPAKAKTIAAYLGKDYLVESSIGHIRDLPNRAAEIPASEKQKPWARLGVDVDHEFGPLYIVNSDKKHVVSDLKAKLPLIGPWPLTPGLWIAARWSLGSIVVSTRRPPSRTAFAPYPLTSSSVTYEKKSGSRIRVL